MSDKLNDIRNRLADEEAAQEPLVEVRTDAMIKVTVEELKEVVAAAKDSPQKAAFSKALKKTQAPPGYVLAVSKVDLQACLDGGTVNEVRTRTEDGAVLISKELAGAAKPAPPKPAKADK